MPQRWHLGQPTPVPVPAMVIDATLAMQGEINVAEHKIVGGITNLTLTLEYVPDIVDSR